jgi:hypothetical protein
MTTKYLLFSCSTEIAKSLQDDLNIELDVLKSSGRQYCIFVREGVVSPGGKKI